MNKLLLVAGIVFLGFSGAVSAQSCSCTGNDQVKGADLTNALQDKTVCVPKGAGWEWQEQHRASGQLWDYKLGSNPVDPTEQVGTWAVSGSGANTIVTHAYGSQSFAYKVCRAGTTTSYGFCPSSGATIMATIQGGTASGCQ